MESNREHERLVNQNRRLLAKMSGLSLRLQSSIQTLSSIMELTAVPITAPNLEAAGRAILEILVRELNGVECCSLLMHVPEKNRLELLAAQGQDDLFDDRVGLFNERLAFTDGEGIAGRVFQENEALFVAPESPERQWLKTSPDLTTPKFLACLPLRQGGLPTGVLNISFNHAKTFDPPRRRDLILLGQVVANVIHAYMLKTELDEKAVSLEAKVRECELEIVERRRTEAKLAASLEDKEILLREIHHRVKNNMQVVSSLINLHSGKSRDARIAEIFGDCQSRLRTMALMHEILYRTDSPGRVDLDVYVKGLVQHLASTHQPPESRIRVLVEAEGMMVGLDQIVPCGLIIHEAVANSFRHAFPGRDGEIRITAHSLEDGRIELIVADDGVGLSGGLEQSDRGKLGFRLITGLVEHQLRGTLQVETEGGTRLIITFTPREQAGPDLRDAGTTADFSGP